MYFFIRAHIVSVPDGVQGKYPLRIEQRTPFEGRASSCGVRQACCCPKARSMLASYMDS